MKKIYILAISALCISSAIAQPTLTQSNNAPTIGETFTLLAYDWDGTEPSAGADVIWDYTSISEGASLTTEYVEKDECTAYESFPDATLALTSDNVNYAFNEYTSEGMFYHGVYAGGVDVEIAYSNPETQMVYPMTFGTTNEDTYAGDFISGGFDFVRSGTTNISAAGYGTLQLPNATIENVLLVKIEQDYNDVYIGGTIQYDVVIYQFFKPGWHYPFLTFNSIIIDGGIPAYTGSFDNSESASIKNKSVAQLSVYPNPVQDVLMIQTANAQEIQAVFIYNLSGQLIYSEDTFIDRINTSELKSGIYYIEIKTANGTAMEKFVKL